MRKISFLVAAFLLLGAEGPCVPTTTTTVRIAGVTPAEGMTGESLLIRGTGLDQPGLYVKLVAMSDGAQYSATVTERKPSWLRITVPSGIGPRRVFDVKVYDGDAVAVPNVPGKSRYAFLRSTGTAPLGKRWKVGVIQTGWEFVCNSAGGGCRWPQYHQIGPIFKGTQSWSTPPFDEHKLFIDQGVRDWATICSQAWQDPTPHTYQLAPAFFEAFPRELWDWNNGFFWESTSHYTATKFTDYWMGSAVARVFARGAIPIPFNGKPEMSFGVFEPSSRYRGTLLDGLTLVFVGALLEYGEQVDPNDPDGFSAITGTSDPGLVNDLLMGGVTGTDTHGMIVISGSPAKDYFLDPTGGGPNSGVFGSIWPLLDAINACDKETCWPGPGYSTDRSPNLLAHEMLHAATSMYDPGILEPFCEDTIAISDSQTYRRGYNAFIEALNRTPKSICQQVFNGAYGKFFTHSF